MIDVKCEKSVNVLIEKELAWVNKLLPMFKDVSIAKDVLTEEIFACDIELGKMKLFFLTLSNKSNDKKWIYETMKSYAVRLALQAIRVAAMCQKAIDSESEK